MKNLNTQNIIIGIAVLILLFFLFKPKADPVDKMDLEILMTQNKKDTLCVFVAKSRLELDSTILFRKTVEHNRIYRYIGVDTSNVDSIKKYLKLALR